MLKTVCPNHIYSTRKIQGLYTKYIKAQGLRLRETLDFTYSADSKYKSKSEQITRLHFVERQGHCQCHGHCLLLSSSLPSLYLIYFASSRSLPSSALARCPQFLLP